MNTAWPWSLPVPVISVIDSVQALLMNRSQLFISLLAALSLSLAMQARADETPAPTANAASTESAQNVVVVGNPAATPEANAGKSWYSSAWDTAGQHLSDIWHKGDIEVLVPFWTYHFPFAYSPEKRKSYTTYPAGGGIGKGYYNDSGNWEGIYLLEYQDSHGKPMYMGGYGWIPTWRPLDDQFKVGVGVTAFMFMRSDIGGYAPLPGALPVASIGYGPVDVQVAYIPGGQGNGNVLFWWAKVAFR